MNIKLALDAHQKMFTDLHSLLPLLEQSAQLIVGALKNWGTLFICWNGGSAADAQHIAAEFTGRYKKERRSLPAIALTTDTSAITAIGNDYNYDRVFSRQLEGLGRKDDILLAISTSGNSPNVLETIRIARDRGMEVIGLTGRDGGIMSRLCDVCMIAPSNETARIQEAHIFCYHVLCEIVDESF